MTLKDEPRTRLDQSIGGGRSFRFAAPALGLRPEMLVGGTVVRVEHRPISDRAAQFGVRLKKVFVAAVQQIHFRIVQRGVDVRIALAIVTTQKARSVR